MAFSSRARLAPADTDDLADIYVMDRESRIVTLESDLTGELAEANCINPRLSGDARYLVFEIVPSSAPGSIVLTSVALRDRQFDRVRHVGPLSTPYSWSDSPDISADGGSVAFVSAATDVVPGPDANDGVPDVYLLHVKTGATERISVDSRGAQAAGRSTSPSLSADGRYVAFVSSRLEARDPAGRRQSEPGPRPHLYVRDVAQRRTIRVDRARSAEPNGAAREPAMSGNGRYVAFVSDASNLVADDRNRSADVFVYDMAGGAISLVSKSAGGGTANGSSRRPRLSHDGRFIAFESDASDLICSQRCTAATEDVNLVSDVYLLDRTTGAIARVSGDAGGVWLEESASPALDDTGTVLAFASRHPTGPEDLANDFDLFVRVAPDALQAKK
jgi:Tol biopolymer transport system component